MSLLKLEECVFCKQGFATPQDLTSHIAAVHTNGHFPNLISASAAATIDFHQFSHQNQNPNFDFSHAGAFQTNSPFSTSISSFVAATTNFHQFSHQNPNPNFGFSHLGDFHTNNNFSTLFSSSAIATTNFQQAFHQNQNPNFGFYVRNPTQEFPVRNSTLDLPVINHLDFNYYRSGPLNNQRRFQREFPPTQGITPTVNYNRLLPKPMDLLLATSPESEDIRTLPLLGKLEKPWPENIGTENNGIKSSSIDLSLKL